jgi:uncharacterized protein
LTQIKGWRAAGRQRIEGLAYIDRVVGSERDGGSGVMASNDGGQAKPYRVLALDGGGIRGYYTTRLLELLLAGIGANPARVDFGRQFDLIVGTSTGTLIGAALAAGVSLPRVSALYREHGPTIFPRPAPIGRWTLVWCAAHWRRASANATALRDALERLLGAMTLAELQAQRGIALCVTVTDLGAARGRVFATPHAASDRDCADLRLVDLCMASSAAPMLLPPIRLPQTGRDDALWCDGGLWATSPVEVAIDEALAVAADERPVEILSIGTCAMPVPSPALGGSSGTGIGMWIRGLRALQAAGDAQAMAAVDFARHLVPHLRRPVRLVRLRDSEPTDSEATVVRLDNARPAAFEAMEALARRSASLNRVDAVESGPDQVWLHALMCEAAGRCAGSAEPPSPG